MNPIDAMGSLHSKAYAEILNLIMLVNQHKVQCKDAECTVIINLVKRTVDRLLNHVYPHEKQDIILKVTDTRWY